MKISEVITRLEVLKTGYGDLDVLTYDEDWLALVQIKEIRHHNVRVKYVDGTASPPEATSLPQAVVIYGTHNDPDSV